jgi:hypothetical protein
VETHVLSLKVDGIQDQPLSEHVGFILSFSSTDLETELLRLSDIPFDGVPEASVLESWYHPTASERPTILDDLSATVEQSSLEDLVEQELKKLRNFRKQALDLHRAIRDKEDQIRDLLLRDCEPLPERWQACNSDLRCLIHVSIQSVPEIYRTVKYQLISLQGPRYPPACHPHGRTPTPKPPTPSYPPYPTSSSHPLPPAKTSSTAHTPTESPNDLVSPTGPILRPTLTIPHDPTQLPDNIRPPFNRRPKEFLREALTIILGLAIFVFILKIICRSNCCRRRRVDRIARSEEQRARRAYLAAARRLRWQRWWYGPNYLRTPASMTSQQSLESLVEAERGFRVDRRNPEQSTTLVDDDQLVDENRTTAEPGEHSMEQEIMGLRRVLEYVGQLVRPGDNDISHSPSPAPYSFRRVRNDSRSPEVVDGAISSTSRAYPNNSPGHRTSGMNSTRSSSLLSLETESLITLESLETAESAPPAYRE